MPSTLFQLKLSLKSRISRLFMAYVGSNTQALYVTTEKGSFLVPATDLSLARSLSLSGAYNKPLLDSIRALIQPQSRVLFVGTHVGTLLIPTAKICAHVTGVEANPFTFKLLEKNLVLNGVSNTTLFNMAAFDKESELEFLANKDNTGGSKVLQPHTNSPEFFYDNPLKIKVKANRLDSVLASEAFDLIVMDIEGSEYKALLGMPNTLALTRQLIIEIHPLGIEKSAGITPQEFFSAIPDKFSKATPLGVTGFKSFYKRDEFPSLYQAIKENHYHAGIDVLFD